MQKLIFLKLSIFFLIASGEAFARGGGRGGVLGGQLDFAGWVLPYLLISAAALIFCMIAMRFSMPTGVPWSMIGTVERTGLMKILYLTCQALCLSTGTLIFAGFFWH